MKVTALQELMMNLGACYQAKRWVRAQTQASAWDKCNTGSWLHFIIESFHIKGVLDKKHLDACNKAYHAREPGVSRAQRIKNAVPYSAIAKAATQYRKDVKRRDTEPVRMVRSRHSIASSMAW